MEKYKVFLSHITDEREVAIALKKGIEELYLNSIEVFVSSDRDSLRGGEQWLNKIMQQLKISDMVLVLASPLSIIKPWINFEAGGGWLIQKPVIPLCYNGLTVSGLSEPLHSLQAIDIDDIDNFKLLFNDISSYSNLGVPKGHDIQKLHKIILSKRVSIEYIKDNSSKNLDKKKVDDNDNKDNDKKQSDLLDEDTAVFFYQRMADVFPGYRDLTWITEPQKAIYHLSHLLREPLVFNSKVRGTDIIGKIEPIWWFRGSSCLGISRFRILSDTKILINHDEIEVDKIAVYRSSTYYRNFIYVEAKPERPTGLYSITYDDIERHIKDFGYSNEEYGLLNNKHLITRQEYDDGSAIIDGKIVDAENADLRIRFLSKYNFILCGQSSVYNSTKHDIISNEYLNGILNGTHTFEEYLDKIAKLPRREIFE